MVDAAMVAAANALGEVLDKAIGSRSRRTMIQTADG
jgi:hypothetical protein